MADGSDDADDADDDREAGAGTDDASDSDDDAPDVRSHASKTAPYTFVGFGFFGDTSPRARKLGKYRFNGHDKGNREFVGGVLLNEFCLRVEAARKRNCMNEAGVANSIGIGRTTYIGYIKGTYPMPLHVMLALVDRFPNDSLWPTQDEVKTWVDDARSEAQGLPKDAASNPASGIAPPADASHIATVLDRTAAPKDAADREPMSNPSTHNRIVGIATEPLTIAARRLSAALPRPDGNPEPTVELIIEDGDSGEFENRDIVTGYVLPELTFLRVVLNDEWLTGFGATGNMVVEGVFILRYLKTPTGKPQKVLGLRALPTYRQDGQLDDYEPAPAAATIVVDADSVPHLNWESEVEWSAQQWENFGRG